MEIEVTRKDLVAGLPGVPDSCPIAISLKRKGYRPLVDCGVVKIEWNQGWHRFQMVGRMPPDMKRFVSEFDGYPWDKCRPTKFEVEFKQDK